MQHAKASFFFMNGAMALAACGLAACGPTPPPAVDTAADEQAIRAISARWLELDRARDAAQIAALFAEDGRLIWTTEPVVGRAAIQEFLTNDFAASPDAMTNWSTERVEVAASGDLAVELGSFSSTNRGQSGAEEEHGRYVTVYRKTGGNWQVLVDTSVSAPTPGTSDADSDIRERIGAFETAWNAHDASAMAATFLPNGDLVLIDSPRHVGREAVREAFQNLFDGRPADCRIHLSVESVRLVQSAVALAEVTAATTNCESPKDRTPWVPKDRATWIWQQRDGSWLVSALRVMVAETG
jgi:uncharacterized protein (TIGR02246 family)